MPLTPMLVIRWIPSHFSGKRKEAAERDMEINHGAENEGFRVVLEADRQWCFLVSALRSNAQEED